MVLNRVDPIFRTTTPIRYIEQKDGGTGFFFNYDDRTYLITNRHVVNPDRSNQKEIYIWNRDSSAIGDANRDTIAVDGASHPDGADIVAIPILKKYNSLNDEGEDNRTGNLAFDCNDIVPEDLRIIGETAIAGYPEEFYDKQTKFPVQQRVSIATPYDVEFEGNQYFLTNAYTHPGTSGSPVTLFANTGWWWAAESDAIRECQKRRYLIGVHSAEFISAPTESLEELKQKAEAADPDGSETVEEFGHDFNQSWYPKTIIETIESI